MTDNFVDIVGFQLEKVHTGVIAWLLDSAAKTLPARERSVVLCALSGIDVGSADQVLTHAEYGQRSKHVDLVVELRCTTQGSKWLVLELKTDSDVDIRQLKASHDFVQRHAPRDKVVPITLALGAAQATIPYAGEEDAPDFKFRAFDADETCSLVKSLSIAGRSHVFDSWVGALAAEQERFTKVEQTAIEIGGFWNEKQQEWEKRGYRPGIPVFYALYQNLREPIEKLSRGKWRIYDGVHNPVMNWRNGNTDKALNRYSASAYWEFNWHALVLKIQPKSMPDGMLITLHDALAAHCVSSTPDARRARRPARGHQRGNSVKVCSWDCGFGVQPMQRVAEHAWSTITAVPPRLGELLVS